MTGHALHGRWRLVDAEHAGDIAIECEFLPEGRLLHAIRAGSGSLLTDLVYRLEADMIVSRQVNATEESRTRFAFEEDGRLRLSGPEATTWYVRLPPRP